MTPLKEECAGQQARPCQPVAHKGPLSSGRSEPGRWPAWWQHWLTLHMVPVLAEHLLCAGRGPIWRRSRASPERQVNKLHGGE